MRDIKKTVKKLARSTPLTRRLYNYYAKKKIERKYATMFLKRMRKLKKLSLPISETNRDLNVIIISIDCLRYRNLSFTGYERETSPFLDQFKAKFKAITAAPWTYPSVASLMTSSPPSVHRADFPSFKRHLNAENSRLLRLIRNNMLTITEILYLAGYRVIYIPTIFLALDSMLGRVVPEVYYDKPSARTVLKKAIKIIRNEKSPFFAYIHLGDLHIPIKIPKKFMRVFGEIDYTESLANWAYREFPKQKGSKFERYKNQRIKLYDSALRYVDHEIEKFVAELKKLNKLDNTIILVTADHGEALWEHAEEEYKFFYTPRNQHGIDHGHNLFNEIIEVPILIEGSDVPSIEINDFYVSTIDIVPTILDMIGLDYRKYFLGKSLFSEEPKKELIISEGIAYGYEKKALIAGDKKFLYAPHDGVKWVYDLSKDLSEKSPITDSPLIEYFEKKLKKFILKQKLRAAKIALSLSQ